MKTKLKFEDIKVGDELVDDGGDELTVQFKGKEHLVTINRSGQEFIFNARLFFMHQSDGDVYLTDYYRPEPTVDSIMQELFGCGYDFHAYEETTKVTWQKVVGILSDLGPEKLKILFGVKDE